MYNSSENSRGPAISHQIFNETNNLNENLGSFIFNFNYFAYESAKEYEAGRAELHYGQLRRAAVCSPLTIPTNKLLFARLQLFPCSFHRMRNIAVFLLKWVYFDKLISLQHRSTWKMCVKNGPKLLRTNIWQVREKPKQQQQRINSKTEQKVRIPSHIFLFNEIFSAKCFRQTLYTDIYIYNIDFSVWNQEKFNEFSHFAVIGWNTSSYFSESLKRLS